MKIFKYISFWLTILILLSLIPRYNFAFSEESVIETDFPILEEVLTPHNAIYSPKTAPRTVIIDKAREYEVDIDLALNLAHFESRLDPYAENPNSTAKGIYQWLDGSWKDFCKGNVFNPEHNIDCAMNTISQKHGIRHWTADLNTREFLVDNGYVICFEGKNNCRLNHVYNMRTEN